MSCNDKKYYSYSKKDCLSASDCSDGEFPYSLGRVCVGVEPDMTTGMEVDDNGAYKCPTDRYIIFNGTVARCVRSAADCPGYYISEEHKACLNSSNICREYAFSFGYKDATELHCVLWADCSAKYNGYAYNDQDCIPAAQCEQHGMHAYTNLRRCWAIEPEPNGGFDPDYLETGEYKCTDSLLDFSGKKARCIPLGTCTELLYKGSMCVNMQ